MKKLVATTMAVVAFGVTSYVAYPWALGQVKDRHPVGYVRYVESRLAKDLETMSKARFRLGAAVQKLTTQNTELSAKIQRARSLANDFRIAYQNLEKSGQDSAVVHGCAYTKPQMFSQVSLLLAEADGYEQAQQELEGTLADGEKQIQQYAVQIGKTESQLAVLATKRELISLQKLTVEGQELLAQVDELMIENVQVAACTPVRPSWEIEDNAADDDANQKVTEYLNAEPEEVASSTTAALLMEVRTWDVPSLPQLPDLEACNKIDIDQVVSSQVPPAPRPPVRKAEKMSKATQAEPDDDAPIFKQSVAQK